MLHVRLVAPFLHKVPNVKWMHNGCTACSVFPGMFESYNTKLDLMQSALAARTVISIILVLSSLSNI